MLPFQGVVEWLKSSPFSASELPTRFSGRTHDYTRQIWGHSVVITEVFNHGQLLKGYGFGHVERGDAVLLANHGETTRYCIDSLERCYDPSDMWWATFTFFPREAK